MVNTSPQPPKKLVCSTTHSLVLSYLHFFDSTFEGLEINLTRFYDLRNLPKSHDPKLNSSDTRRVEKNVHSTFHILVKTSLSSRDNRRDRFTLEYAIWILFTY